jgi:hypothetical protein
MRDAGKTYELTSSFPSYETHHCGDTVREREGGGDRQIHSDSYITATKIMKKNAREKKKKKKQKEWGISVRKSVSVFEVPGA